MHWRQGREGSSATLSPGFREVTREPVAWTVAVASCPVIRGWEILVAIPPCV